MIKLFRDSNFFGIRLQGHLECYKCVFMIEKKIIIKNQIINKCCTYQPKSTLEP